jgi:hypothetical protein
MNKQCTSTTYLLHQTSGLGVIPDPQYLKEGSKTRVQYSLDKSIWRHVARMSNKNKGEALDEPFDMANRASHTLFEHLPSLSPIRSLCQTRTRLAYPSYA